MKTNYEAPQIEVIEVEIEDAVLVASPSLQSVESRGRAW